MSGIKPTAGSSSALSSRDGRLPTSAQSCACGDALARARGSGRTRLYGTVRCAAASPTSPHFLPFCSVSLQTALLSAPPSPPFPASQRDLMTASPRLIGANGPDPQLPSPRTAWDCGRHYCVTHRDDLDAMFRRDVRKRPLQHSRHSAWGSWSSATLFVRLAVCGNRTAPFIPRSHTAAWSPQFTESSVHTEGGRSARC